MALGKIIILNGVSSSGKTSIIRILQDILEEPYVEAGVDKFIWMLPRRYLDHPLWDEVLGLATEAGPVGQRLISGMYQSIAALSRAGVNVVARAIAFGRYLTTEERKWGVLVGVCPHQNTPNTLFAGLRMPLRAYAIALMWWQTTCW